GRELGWSPTAVAAAAIGAVVLANRAFHLDGLADTADGLTGSYAAERIRQIMKAGNSGPAGVAAIVVVLVIQIFAVASMSAATWGPVGVALVICLARSAACAGCLRGVPSASSGVGATFAGTISLAAMGVMTTGAIAVGSATAMLIGLPWW